KILIVDDDDLVLSCFVRLLGRQFNIETAMGPYAALDAIAARGPYAVVLSDLRMPGMNGVQLLEKAKQVSPNTVGLVLSGNVVAGEITSDVIYKVLGKPCSTAVLSNVLTEAIRLHHELCRAE